MKFQARNNYLINWPEYPLLRITICFIIGIYLSDSFSIPLLHSLSATAGLLVTFILINSYFTATKNVIRLLSSLVLLIGIFLGILRGNLQQTSNIPNHFTNYIEDENQMVGRVISELKQKKRISTTIDILNINGIESSGKLLIYFSKADSLLKYQIGNIISIDGKVQRLKDNPNPKSFNYKNHLKYKGIDCQIFLKDDMHKLISSTRSNIVTNSAGKIRKWALAIFEERIQEKDQLATASAMVLGYKEYLSKDLYNSFSETGAVHVLAVSGLHVGIICMIFMVFFEKIKSDSIAFKLTKLISLLSIVWIYALVTGGSPAVMRAAVMFSLILIGRLWFSGANIYNILACSALLILMYDPYLLFQLSFQFSYLALISIVFFQPLLERLYETKHWITTKVWQLTTVSIAAQILVFPISVYHFHQFPTYFILSGISAVFLASFILGLGLLLLCLNNVPELGDYLSFAYSNLLEGFIQIISGIQSLPFNSVEGVYFSKQSIVVIYLLIGVLMFLLSLKPHTYKDILHKKSTRKKIAKLIGAACVVFLLANSIIYTYGTKHHNEFIVYDISRSTAIDIFSYGKLYTIQSENIDGNKVDFACSTYRIYKGNPKATPIIYEEECNMEYLSYSKKGSLIFKNKHLYFINNIDMKDSIPCRSDVLFVSNQTELLPYKILEYHSTSLVILDNSLSYRVKNHWQKECNLRGIPVHDIRRDGVFKM